MNEDLIVLSVDHNTSYDVIYSSNHLNMTFEHKLYDMCVHQMSAHLTNWYVCHELGLNWVNGSTHWAKNRLKYVLSCNVMIVSEMHSIWAIIAYLRHNSWNSRSLHTINWLMSEMTTKSIYCWKWTKMWVTVRPLGSCGWAQEICGLATNPIQT